MESGIGKYSLVIASRRTGVNGRMTFARNAGTVLRRGCMAAAVGLVLAAAFATAARADKAGCEYKDIDVAKYGEKPFQNPPQVVSHNGVLDTRLVAGYTDPNTVSIGGCGVKLRTYNGELVGPTLRVKSGDVLDVLLDNRLPTESPNEVAAQYEQERSNAHLSVMPASFNTTNLHTHGLHVSPVGNSDNVLLAILPQTKFPFEIKVPASHPPGTFWYHAHTHGSTSIQVGSGMAGALIIEDDNAKIPPALREANKGEKIMVLQTILYNTDGELNQITALFPDQDPCPASNNATWGCSKRQVTINGQIRPVITMRPGEVQRWRLIDSAFRQSFDIRLEGHSLHEIALDGLYLGRVDTWGPAQTVELQPGYRSDVLLQASKTPGRYRLINGALSADQSLRAVAQPEQVLAIVVVEGEPMEMTLPTSAEMAPLAPFPDVDLKSRAVGVQTVVFKLGQDVPGTRNYFQINAQAFDPNHSRKLVLNNVDQWNLSTIGDPVANNGIPPLPHVFHIHINPFQMERKDPAGRAETVWKDTVLVPPKVQVNVYTQYTDYIGAFVLHCHILDHEDLGMMEVVEVVSEEGATPLHAVPPHRH
jgi:FtsP/CotA-like multicopper oxidase with cupredoxin domain